MGVAELLIIVVWGLVAWAVVVLARRKGRRRWLWGILGLVLPLPALLAVLFSPPLHRSGSEAFRH